MNILSHDILHDINVHCYICFRSPSDHPTCHMKLSDYNGCRIFADWYAYNYHVKWILKLYIIDTFCLYMLLHCYSVNASCSLCGCSSHSPLLFAHIKVKLYTSCGKNVHLFCNVHIMVFDIDLTCCL